MLITNLSCMLIQMAFGSFNNPDQNGWSFTLQRATCIRTETCTLHRVKGEECSIGVVMDDCGMKTEMF